MIYSGKKTNRYVKSLIFLLKSYCVGLVLLLICWLLGIKGDADIAFLCSAFWFLYLEVDSLREEVE